MKINQWKGSGRTFVLLASCVPAAFCVNAAGQTQQKVTPKETTTQSAGPGAYDAARETVLSGNVAQYIAKSNVAPLGAHITLQTSSGTVDVHAGNAKLIAAGNISLQAGDAVTVTGENVAFGNKTVFVARVIQKGTQSVTVRSKNGMPLAPTARNANGQMVQPAGVR